MTTKTDLSAISLSAAEINAAYIKGGQPGNLLDLAKLKATELAQQLNTLIGVLPAGANVTALTTIRAALL